MLNNSNDVKLSTQTKVFFLLIFLLICVFSYIFRLYSMQIINGEHYKTQSKTLSSQVNIIPAQRGEIFDRKALYPIVVNSESFAVEVTPAEIPANKYDTVISKLASFLGMTKASIDKKNS